MGLAFLEKSSSQFWVGEMYNVQENMRGGECFEICLVRRKNAYGLRSGFFGFVSPVVG